MRTRDERRRNPRLNLSFPIELSFSQEGRAASTRAVTANLSARGAYFRTFSWRDFDEGQQVHIRIQVPHRLQESGETIQLHMRAKGKLSRVESESSPEVFGEDGIALGGVAVEFDSPLEFRYLWM